MIFYCPELNQMVVALVTITVDFEITETAHRWITYDFEMNHEIFLNYEWFVVGHL